jgi:hypothetical protein
MAPEVLMRQPFDEKAVRPTTPTNLRVVGKE